jgi:hypothetical protein
MVSRPSHQFQEFPARHKAPLPADRLAAIAWWVGGTWLGTPFAQREGDLTTAETEAIQEMRVRLEGDGSAGLLPASGAFWFNPADGRTQPLSATRAWLRVRIAQYIVVDRRLLEAMGRPVPVTLLPLPSAKRRAGVPGFGYGPRHAATPTRPAATP